MSVDQRETATAERIATADRIEAAPHGELARRPVSMAPASVMSDGEINSLWRLAESLNASGNFKVNGAADAFARVLIGRDLGLSPTRALMTIDLVHGGIQMRGVLLLAFVKMSEQYDYKIVEHTQERAEIEWYEKSKRTGEWGLAGTTDFDLERAEKLRSFTPGKPEAAWNTARENMLIWRAASNGVKFYCPDLLGGVAIYTEADDFNEPAINLGAADAVVVQGLTWEGVSIEDQAAVEKVIRRAEKHGHAGLADRDTVIMSLNHQPRAAVAKWLEAATAELDKLKAAKPKGLRHTPIERAEGRFCTVCGEKVASATDGVCPGPAQTTVSDAPDGAPEKAEAGASGGAPAPSTSPGDAEGDEPTDREATDLVAEFDERESTLMDELLAAREKGDADNEAEVQSQLDALAAERDAYDQGRLV